MNLNLAQQLYIAVVTTNGSAIADELLDAVGQAKGSSDGRDLTFADGSTIQVDDDGVWVVNGARTRTLPSWRHLLRNGNGPSLEQLPHNVFDEYEEAARAHAHARVEELTLEDERQEAKHAAMLRVLQTPNEYTGKAHSATSAEAVVALDPGYKDYLRRCREAVLRSMLTATERDVRYARMMQHATRGDQR